ncbi:Fatty-acid-binding protein [Thalictrum thalictroides]|uniref:Fatty-acid-binding protein n=1 Tax=Thalictrum thalictroides TaxID=46969 RepID=A0A7J6VP12_THATH|nr:Fatty-acid-binding protein [Thalictrum thalictroides]
MDLDGGSPYNFPTDHYFPGSLAFQEAVNCISKFTGAFLLWFGSGSNNVGCNISGKAHGSKPRGFRLCPLLNHGSSCKHNLVEMYFGFKSRAESSIPVLFGKIANSTIKHIRKELEQLQAFPVLSLASGLMPPVENLSPNVLSTSLENSDVLLNDHGNRATCLRGHRGSTDLSFDNLNWSRHSVEPVTGIQFPTVLDNISDGQNNSTPNTEVLVGTGSRSMKIFKVKSLKVYAFGLYVQPDSICRKLGPKYASVPVGELNHRPEFFDDLLRESIHMTVRLVVNCNGMKISAVRDAFEKSLRARLLKMNPRTDYQCLKTFDSYFSQDIPIPAGTTISFQQTVDGQLITEIGGKRMGAVRSKDLCGAFFGMYIGDSPVSLQTKEEIAKNVGSIIGKC